MILSTCQCKFFHIISVWCIWCICLWRFMRKWWRLISVSLCSIQLFLLLIYYSLWAFSTVSLSQSCVTVISSRNEPVGTRGCNCDPCCSFTLGMQHFSPGKIFGLSRPLMVEEVKVREWNLHSSCLWHGTTDLHKELLFPYFVSF